MDLERHSRFQFPADGLQTDLKLGAFGERLAIPTPARRVPAPHSFRGQTREPSGVDLGKRSALRHLGIPIKPLNATEPLSASFWSGN
jgi:hypothetical protein